MGNTNITDRNVHSWVEAVAYPKNLIYVDKWMVPKFVAAMPPKIQEQIHQEQQAECMLRGVDIMFALLKFLKPDSLEENP